MRKGKGKEMSITPVMGLEQRIMTVRGQRVMIDADLAELYGVPTRRLNEQVKRNRERFPVDFMFQLTAKEKGEVIANCDHLKRLKFSPVLPYAFTEHGAIMAANLLNSKQAIAASVRGRSKGDAMKKKSRFEKIDDYGTYDGFDQLSLSQAAFLWCGYKPPAQVMKSWPPPSGKPTPFFPDDDYPPDVFAMNQELQQTLRKYWRSIAGIINGLNEEAVSRIETKLNYNYSQWGELYVEFIINIIHEMGKYPIIELHCAETVDHKGARIQKKIIRLRMPLRNQEITEFDFINASLSLFNQRPFSRKAIMDYAKKRPAPVPFFLLNPKERTNLAESEKAGNKLPASLNSNGRRHNFPLGTRWKDVAIKVSYLKMTVDLGGNRFCTVEAKDVPAFYDHRKKGMTQSKLWNIFSGWVDCTTIKETPKRVSQIRKALKNIFSMTDDPLPYNKKSKKWSIAFTLTEIKN